MMTQQTRSQLKKKCDRLASLYYRAETPFCEARGLDGVNCGGPLEWAHIFSRVILHIRYEPYNKLILCSGHHRYHTNKPIEWTRFLEKHFADRLAKAEAVRYGYAKLTVADYQAWIEYFQEKGPLPGAGVLAA
jgi:hypothetical protein